MKQFIAGVVFVLSASVGLGASDISATSVTATTVKVAPVAFVVRSDGWSADVYVHDFTTGGTFDFTLGANNAPASTTPYIDVTSKGFDATGAATTHSRRVYIVQTIRKPDPNDGDRDEAVTGALLRVRVGLSDPIYAKDKVGAGNSGTDPVLSAPVGWITNTGGASEETIALIARTVSNESTLAYPKAIGQWDWRTTDAFQRKEANFPIAYRARAAFGIAAVILDATGVTSSHNQTSTVTTLSTVGPCASGLYYDTYSFTVPIAGFTQDETINLRARVYPYIGDTTECIDTDTLTDLNSAQNGKAQITVTCDKGSTLKTYAVVRTSATGGDDDTGVVSATLATADASPYATISGAITDGATVVYVTDDGTGIHELGQTPVGSAAYAIEIRPLPTDVADNITIQESTATENMRLKHLLIAGGLHLDFNGTVYFDLKSATTAKSLTLDGVNFDATSDSPRTSIYRTGLALLIDCYLTNHKLFQYATDLHCWSAMGCTFQSGYTGAMALSSFGCLVACAQGDTNYSLTFVRPSDANTQKQASNVMVEFNRFDRLIIPVGAASWNWTDSWLTGDYSFVGNVFAAQSKLADNPVFSLFTSTAVDNIIWFHNTLAGERINGFYCDTNNTVKSNIFFKGNAIQRLASKTDTFAPGDGTRVGNWSVHFGCGFRYNRYDHTLNFPMEFLGTDSASVGNSNNVGEMDYVDEGSIDGSDAGGGDYTPNVTSVLYQAMPASAGMVGCDLTGTAWPGSGNANIGAIQP